MKVKGEKNRKSNPYKSRKKTEKNDTYSNLLQDSALMWTQNLLGKEMTNETKEKEEHTKRY
jgi:cytochrome b involved in lipid metabolism